MKGGRQTIAVTITIIKCNKNSLGCQTTSYWPSRKKPYFQEVETCAKWNVVASVLLLFTFVPYWVHSISLLLFSLVPRMVDNAKQCTNFFHIHIFSQMNLWDIYIYIYICVCVYIYNIFHGIQPVALQFTDNKSQISIWHNNFIIFNNVCYMYWLCVVYKCLKMVKYNRNL